MINRQNYLHNRTLYFSPTHAEHLKFSFQRSTFELPFSPFFTFIAGNILKQMNRNVYWYCFNPLCSDCNQRVFLQGSRPYSHLFCKKWLISEQKLANFSKQAFSFDKKNALDFDTDPIRTQAYLYYAKKQILTFLEDFSSQLKTITIMKIDCFRETIKKVFQEEFMFQKFTDLQALATKQGLNSCTKAQELKKLLQKPFPMLGKVILPNQNTLKSIVASLHSSLQRIFLVKLGETESIGQQSLPKLNEETQNLAQEKAKWQDLQPKQSLNLQKSDVNRSKSCNFDEQNAFLELRQYINQNCNLDTAAKLMRESHQKFYYRDNKSNESRIQCGYCEFEVTLKTKTKPQTNSACSYAIMDHLYKQHTISILHNYYLAKEHYFPTSLLDFLNSGKHQSIKQVILIDSAGFSHSNKISLDWQRCLAFEMVFGLARPLHLCEYLKGETFKDFNFLVGLIISHFTLTLKKGLLIYTNQQRGQLVQNFCNDYKIDGVRVIIPQKKLKTDLAQTKPPLQKNKEDNDLE